MLGDAASEVLFSLADVDSIAAIELILDVGSRGGSNLDSPRVVKKLCQIDVELHLQLSFVIIFQYMASHLVFVKALFRLYMWFHLAVQSIN